MFTPSIRHLIAILVMQLACVPASVEFAFSEDPTGLEPLYRDVLEKTALDGDARAQTALADEYYL